MGWLLWRLYCSIAIVCVGRHVLWLLIKVVWCLAFAGDEILDCSDFIGALLMPGRVVSFATCAFVDFDVALEGWVMLAAFGADIMETPTCRGVMSKLLAFIALNQLELGGVFLCSESSMVDVKSMLEAVVAHV